MVASGALSLANIQSGGLQPMHERGVVGDRLERSGSRRVGVPADGDAIEAVVYWCWVLVQAEATAIKVNVAMSVALTRAHTVRTA